MLPGELGRLRAAARPTLSPDGHDVVYAVGGPDLETDDYVSHLWIARGEAPPQRLTFGHCDTAPALSPDGRWLAFTRREEGGKPQLMVMRLGGGEPYRLTDLPLGVAAPQWSPDATHLAFLARVPDAGRYDPDVPPAKEAPRLITSYQYRRDNIGFVGDRPQQLHVVHLPALDADEFEAVRSDGESDPQRVPRGDLRCLTSLNTDVRDFAWLPDAETIAIVAPLHQGHDRDLVADLALVPIGGGEPRPLLLGVSVDAVAAGDGYLAVLAQDLGPRGLDFVARNAALYRYDLARHETVRLTDPEDLALQSGGSLTVRDARVFALAERAGSLGVVAIDATPRRGESAAVTTLVDAPAVVSSFALDATGRTLAIAVARHRTPGDLEVHRLDLDRGPRTEPQTPPRVVTRLGAWCADWVREPVAVTYRGRDGYPVHGWVSLPPGPGPHPVVLMVHGGPYAQYTGAFFDEEQVVVRAGYAVVRCNPRGSAGYGQAHGRAIMGDFGHLDAHDVLDFLDGALGDPRLSLDAVRTAVMGGSYGGYMAAWLTTMTQRFTAAIVERGFLDGVSFVGSSDIGWFFSAGYLAPDAETGSPGESAALAAQSPLAHVGQVATPTLVIHSENDWRCPVEQGQRWYVELKRRGVPTELLLFPGEGHELSRSGLPSHRVARFEHILRWLDAHLGPRA